MATSGRSRWAKRLLLGCALPTAVCLAGFALFLQWVAGGPSDGLCANQILYEQTSPDGALKAVVFERDCGATTGFSTQISILSTNQDLPNEGGNLFTCDTNHGAAPSGLGGGPDVDVAWLAPNHLRVKYDQQVRVFTNDPRRTVRLPNGATRNLTITYARE